MVDAVTMLDELMPLNMIGIKKVQGGSLEESLLVPGVAFKKTFSYAGFEMQQKSYKNPRIALLNIELELKAEKDNAEVRVDNVEEVLYWKLEDETFLCDTSVVLVLQPHWLHFESESATLDTDICVTVQGPQIGAGNRYFG